MKTKQILWGLVAAVAALGLTACDEKEPSGVLKLNKTTYSMSVGDEYTLKATIDEATVEATWSTSNEAVVTVDAGKIVGVAEGSATITATAQGQTATCAVTVEAVIEDLPSLEAPGAGKVTIAVRLPENCGTAVIPGKHNGVDVWDVSGAKTEIICSKVEGTQSWVAVTLDWAEGDEFKVAGLNDELKGDAGWANEAKSGTVLEGDIKGNFGENLVILSDNQVIYVAVEEWKLSPCVQGNEAGTATFNLTATGFPEGTVWAVVGSFGWLDSGSVVEMTLGDNGIWTATHDVPANCQYKYVNSTDGASWQYYSKDNINMDVTLKTNDTEVFTAPEEAEDAQ